MLHPQPVYIFIDDAKPHQKPVDIAVVCIEQQIEDKSHHLSLIHIYLGVLTPFEKHALFHAA